MTHKFGWIDWTVLALYAAGLLGIGFHFARRQRTTEEYFVGGRRMNPIIAGISVFAAYFSILSYIAITGEYVGFGPGFALFAALSLPFVYLFASWFVIPFIMRLPITSAYELLEGRLGRGVRQAGSLSFIVSRLIWMALILYTSSRMLVSVMGCDPRWAVLITVATGAVTTTYTLVGGIRTVMVTEVMQAGLLLTGAVLTIFLISMRVGGVGAWWPRHLESFWPPQPWFSFDPSVRVTLIGAFMAQLLGCICISISDQGAVQRLLTTRDAREARRAYLLSNVIVIALFALLSLVGAALIVFYRRHPEAVPPGLTFARNGDAFFPLFISHSLPTGISGLIVASLLAGAMSCLAGGINATITVLTKDFIEVSRAGGDEASKLRRTRRLVLALGAVVVLGSIGMGSVRGNLNEVAAKTTGIFICPAFSLFFLAMFVKRATPFGAIMGAIYGVAGSVLPAFWDVLTDGHSIGFLWITPISFVASVAGGCLFSLLPTRNRPPRILAVYAALVLGPPTVLLTAIILHLRSA